MTKRDKKWMESNETNEITEEKTHKDKIEWNTSQELLSTIAENMVWYYEKNKQLLKWKSLEDIFFSYIENDKKIIEQVELKLWKEISFEDIKNLYLNTHYTLEETLTKDIFKEFENKNAIKSIIKTFQEKINMEWLNINFSKLLAKKLSSNEDIDELFRNIKDEIHSELKKIPKEDADKIKNIKITNEEIIEQLIKDGIIKNSRYLKSSINELRESQEKEIKNILNIQTTLLNANIINNIYEVEKKFDLINKDINRITYIGSFSNILEKYNINNMEQSEINDIFETIEIDETDKYFLNNLVERLDNSSWESKITHENTINLFKKRKVLKELETNENEYLKYVQNHEKDHNEEWLSKILKKLLNQEILKDDEKSFIINNILEKNYVDNITRFITKGFNLTKEQEEKYKEILKDLLNPSKHTLTLPNTQKVNIKKNIKFPEINNIEDIFELEPIITFDIEWNDVNIFKNIFPNYFTKINNKDYSIFTKTKIKDKEGNEYIWYLQEGIKQWEVDIYESNPIENSTNPIKTISLNDIYDINLEEEEKLNLDSRSDLKNLCTSMVSYFEDKKREYASYKLYETTKEIKNNEEWSYNKEQESIKENNELIDIKNFEKEWNRLEWDEKTMFEVGSIMQIKWKSLDLPWITSNWFYAEIIDIDKESWYFKLKVNGGGLLNLEDWEWHILDIPMIPKWITRTKFNNGWNIFKFNKINNIEEFWKNIKQIELKSDFQWFQKWLSLWSNNIEIKNNKLVKKNKKWEYEEIKYMWGSKNMKINNLDEVRENNKHISKKFDAWEIQVDKNHIILKHPYDKNFSKKIDFNTFLILGIQNKLTPWTEDDFKNTEENLKFNPHTPERKWRLFSFDNIMLWAKQLKENFSYYFKEEDELRAAEMYEKMAWVLPDFWFLWDVKMEAWWEKESKVWKRIENSKSRLERAWEWKGKNHWKVAATIIEKEIFKKIEKWESLNYRTRLKAAWYLIYALENGPWPYFRSLAWYEWKWYWVRAILWESHYLKWKKRKTQLEEQLKKDPWNWAIKDELIKSEVFYIKDAKECAKMYSENFWSTIEGMTINNVYSGWKVQEAYEWESTKWTYSLISWWLNSYILNNRPPNSLWALKAISETISDYDDYVDYYKTILSFIFSWYLYNNFSWWFWWQFWQICRTYWIPIWLFWDELYGLNKILTIFDYIVEQKKDIDLWWKSFTEYIYWEKDPWNIDVLSLNTKSTRASIMWKLNEFWWLYWASIVASLDYTDIELLKWTWDENIDKEKKVIINEYFWKVNDDISEDFSFNSDLDKSSYAPYYQNWIFNVPTWTFSKIALDIHEWDFGWRNSSISKWIWKWIEIKLEWMQDVMDNNEVYEFLVKKFINWFGRFYSWSTEIELIQALWSWNTDQLNEIIISANKENYWSHWNIPIEMENWLKKFAETFEKRPENIEKVLYNVFWENKVTRALNNM